MIITTIPSRTTLRAFVALGALAALSACGVSYSGNALPVRGGPQAVHPSPSALAQGAALVATTPVAYSVAPTCNSTYGGADCSVSTANDGSQPIID